MTNDSLCLSLCVSLLLFHLKFIINFYEAILLDWVNLHPFSLVVIIKDHSTIWKLAMGVHSHWIYNYMDKCVRAHSSENTAATVSIYGTRIYQKRSDRWARLKKELLHKSGNFKLETMRYHLVIRVYGWELWAILSENKKYKNAREIQECLSHLKNGSKSLCFYKTLISSQKMLSD